MARSMSSMSLTKQIATKAKTHSRRRGSWRWPAKADKTRIRSQSSHQTFLARSSTTTSFSNKATIDQLLTICRKSNPCQATHYSSGSTWERSRRRSRVPTETATFSQRPLGGQEMQWRRKCLESRWCSATSSDPTAEHFALSDLSRKVP